MNDLVQPSTDTIGMLRDLVDALDRRVPQADVVPGNAPGCSDPRRSIRAFA